MDETSRQFTVSDKGIDWGSEGQDILHLQYDNANKLLDYGLYDAPATVTLDDVTLETKAGWSKLLIRQCYQHDSGTGSSLKTDLGEQDITDLFSGTVTVRVANDRAEGLTIAKTVTGNTAPAGESYQIEIYVEDDEKPIEGSYETVSGAGESGSITFKEGKATDSLQAGESLTIFDLPNGASYTVTETQSQEQAYTTTVSVNHGQAQQEYEATGTLTDDGQTVRFINAYPTKPGGHDPGMRTSPSRRLRFREAWSARRPPATGAGRRCPGGCWPPPWRRWPWPGNAAHRPAPAGRSIHKTRPGPPAIRRQPGHTFALPGIRHTLGRLGSFGDKAGLKALAAGNGQKVHRFVKIVFPVVQMQGAVIGKIPFF